ncbi:alpha/beta hydrolase [Shewanella sp. YLB-07]|uniref:alpha/beta hydrolase n=1 Tax=Shewanella sp. YLB-07 TaxID=2601268 RepID=UPI00128DE4BC|nr:alpha/beta hydrolase [Shewanella sp. YLB-07]MPY22646.1 alpha/beta hydrolase [Shewanella sp. YLB-07]
MIKKIATFSLSIILLSACGDTGSAALKEPKIDYDFTTDKENIISERHKILNSFKLSVGGDYFSLLYGKEIRFKDETGKINVFDLLKIKNDTGDEIDMIIPSLENTKEAQYCQLFFQTESKLFSCSADKRSENEDLTFIQSTLNGNDVGLEFSQYINAIGSTSFEVRDLTDTSVTLKTVNVFPEFGDSSDLGFTTYLKLEKLVNSLDPALKMTLVFDSVIDGSSDDDINMYTGLLIRDRGMNTVVSANGSVFSGGTDLFSAGVERLVNSRNSDIEISLHKQVGVHSWAGDEKVALDIPFSDESHHKQGSYFNKMLGKKGIPFYLFTLNAAPAEGEHWMTSEEFSQFGLAKVN